MKKVFQRSILAGLDGVVHAEAGAVLRLDPQHHVRMVEEIPVDGVPVLVCPKAHPIRHDDGGGFPFLEEQDVRDHRCVRVCLKSVLRQADRAEQVRPLRDVPPRFLSLRVHRVA